jgi:Putative phage abortive infection protein
LSGSGSLKPWQIALWAMIAMAAIAAWATYPAWATSLFAEKSVEALGKLGTFGDAFGALNTLFSGLAFSGIALSLVLQFRQINEAFRENKRLRDLSHEQQFEGTFFNLLLLHNSTVNSLELQTQTNVVVRGKLIFEFLCRHLDGDRYPSLLSSSDEAKLSNSQKYLLLLSEHAGVLMHHISTLRQIARFISVSAPTPDHNYGAFLRSQISPYEAVLLLLHCAAHPEDTHLLRYVEDFALLENIKDAGTLENEDIRAVSAHAYGANPIHQRSRTSEA